MVPLYSPLPVLCFSSSLVYCCTAHCSLLSAFPPCSVRCALCLPSAVYSLSYSSSCSNLLSAHCFVRSTVFSYVFIALCPKF
jgi:hypothetical protein